jgi:WS/DGAT/MGAT family acyltransferase
MDRLSTLDSEFLHIEDDVSRLHIGAAVVFGGEPPEVDDLSALIAGKLHVIPRYRQRVTSVPLDLGRPVWVDDPHFNLSYHVRHTALPGPGDDEALWNLVGRVMSQPLDHHRPLWECWLVEGLADDRWALVFKVHHCMVDGVAGVGLLTALLDLSSDASILMPEPWIPSPEPSSVALVADAWSGLASDAASWLGRVPHLLADPAGALGGLVDTAKGITALVSGLRATPEIDLDGEIGPHRVWAHSQSSLVDVKRFGKAHGATVNDVVLAAVAGGFRTLMLNRGLDPAEVHLRTLVPVSVRRDDGEGVPDNRVSSLLYELPVDEPDPAVRLERVHTAMAELKESGMAEAGELVTNLGNLAPPFVVSAVSKVAVRAMGAGLVGQRAINTVTTNVPGPQIPLYCLGRTMEAYLPYVPLSHGVRIGVAILSYNGHLFFGVTGDLDTAPDVRVLATAISEEIASFADE